MTARPTHLSSIKRSSHIADEEEERNVHTPASPFCAPKMRQSVTISEGTTGTFESAFNSYEGATLASNNDTQQQQQQQQLATVQDDNNNKTAKKREQREQFMPLPKSVEWRPVEVQSKGANDDGERNPRKKATPSKTPPSQAGQGEEQQQEQRQEEREEHTDEEKEGEMDQQQQREQEAGILPFTTMTPSCSCSDIIFVGGITEGVLVPVTAFSQQVQDTVAVLVTTSSRGGRNLSFRQVPCAIRDHDALEKKRSNKTKDNKNKETKKAVEEQYDEEAAAPDKEEEEEEWPNYNEFCYAVEASRQNAASPRQKTWRTTIVNHPRGNTVAVSPCGRLFLFKFVNQQKGNGGKQGAARGVELFVSCLSPKMTVARPISQSDTTTAMIAAPSSSSSHPDNCGLPLFLLSSLTGHSICGDNTHSLLVTGGCSFSSSHSHQQHQQQQHRFNTKVYRFDVQSCKWTAFKTTSIQVPPMVTHHSSVLYNSEVLVFGGFIQGLVVTNKKSINKKRCSSAAASSSSSSVSTAAPHRSGSSCRDSSFNDNLSCETNFQRPSALKLQEDALGQDGQEEEEEDHGCQNEGKTKHQLVSRMGNGLYSFDTAFGAWKHVNCVGEVPPPRAYHDCRLYGDWMIVAGGEEEGQEHTTAACVYMLHCKYRLWVCLDAGSRLPFAPGHGLQLYVTPQDAICIGHGVGASSSSGDGDGGHADEQEEQKKEEQEQQKEEGGGQRGGLLQICIAHIKTIMSYGTSKKNIILQQLRMLNDEGNTSLKVRTPDQMNATFSRLHYVHKLPESLHDPRKQRAFSEHRKKLASLPQPKVVTRPANVIDANVERLLDYGSDEHRERRTRDTLTLLNKSNPVQRRPPARVDEPTLLRRVYEVPREVATFQEHARAEQFDKYKRMNERLASAWKMKKIVDRLSPPPPAQHGIADEKDDGSAATRRMKCTSGETLARLQSAGVRQMEHRSKLYEKYGVPLPPRTKSK